MKSICIIIVAAIVLFGIATHSMHRNQANPYADQIIGSWVMYEGGNVAPEVLSFFANGSGYSYMRVKNLLKQINHLYILHPLS